MAKRVVLNHVMPLDVCATGRESHARLSAGAKIVVTQMGQELCCLLGTRERESDGHMSSRQTYLKVKSLPLREVNWCQNEFGPLSSALSLTTLYLPLQNRIMLVY